jgi:hypothetical protein
MCAVCVYVVGFVGVWGWCGVVWCGVVWGTLYHVRTVLQALWHTGY